MKTRGKIKFIIGTGALLFPLLSSAWWGTGHEVIAAIAYSHLTKDAKDKVDNLLQAEINWPDAPATAYLPTPKELGKFLNDYITASTWADDIKSYKWSNPDEDSVYSEMHYIDVPMIIPFALKQAGPIENECVNVDWAQLTHDQISDAKGDKHDDVVSAAESAMKTLLSKGSDETAEKKAVAMRFLLHFAGDVTMPFHALQPTFNFVDDAGNSHSVSTRGANLIKFPSVKVPNHLAYDGDKVTTNSINEWHGLWDSAVNLYDNVPGPANASFEKDAKEKWDKYETEYRKYITAVANEIDSKFSKDPGLNSEIKKNPSFEYWAEETAATGCAVLSSKYYGDALSFTVEADSKKPDNYNISMDFKRGYDNYKNDQNIKGVAAKQLYIAGIHLAYVLNAMFTKNAAYTQTEALQDNYRDYVKDISNGNSVKPLDKLVDGILHPTDSNSNPKSQLHPVSSSSPDSSSGGNSYVAPLAAIAGVAATAVVGESFSTKHKR